VTHVTLLDHIWNTIITALRNRFNKRPFVEKKSIITNWSIFGTLNIPHATMGFYFEPVYIHKTMGDRIWTLCTWNKRSVVLFWSEPIVDNETIYNSYWDNWRVSSHKVTNQLRTSQRKPTRNDAKVRLECIGGVILISREHMMRVYVSNKNDNAITVTGPPWHWPCQGCSWGHGV